MAELSKEEFLRLASMGSLPEEEIQACWKEIEARRKARDSIASSQDKHGKN